MAAVTLRGDLNRPLTNAEMDANFINLNAELATKESAITAAPTAATAKYWRGDKTWQDFSTSVCTTVLAGLSTATSTVVAATDTVLAAIGKLQAQVSAKFDKTGGNINGNLNFTGTARRITGDFSNATIANRGMVQTNVVNGATLFRAIPNGSSATAGYQVGNSSDPANQSTVTLLADTARVAVVSGANGARSVLPLVFDVSGERLRIDPITGNVLATSGALGYGVGAGGTVVQATSKSTAVTLNKPSGYIRLHDAPLDAGAAVTFTLNNSFINVGGDPQDCLVVNPYANNNYRVEIAGLFGGAAAIRVTNLTGGSLSEVLLVQFQLIKGAST